jgi:dTDP-glucose 4,6-dehydratase
MQFKESAISLIEHDLSSATLDLPISDYYVHGATPSVRSTGSMNQQKAITSTLNGSISITNAIMKEPVARSVTFLSSGAVFGHQPSNMSHRPERSAEFPNHTLSPYGVSKLANELLISQLKSNFGTPISTPRLFAFYGPHIALDEHFAIGNFMRDASSGDPIKVLGNSQTTRSYMYPTDLIKNLLQLIVHPEDIPINLGSADALTLGSVAECISSMFGDVGIQFLGEEKPSNHYVPETPWMINNTQNITSVSFEDGLERWKAWLETST